MDVKKLTQEPSVQVRGMLAAKIAMDFRANQFSASEEAVAVDIFRLLLKDAEVQIRRALAEELAHCPNAPHDIILKLAHDVSEVAVPVIEFSSVLDEDDLITIVQSSREVIKLCAVARRPDITEDVSSVLMHTMNTLVLQNLFRNKAATVNERQLMKSWDTISTRPSLLETLVERGGLPLTIAEKLFYIVSENLKSQLTQQYPLHKPLIHKTAEDAREWELLGITPDNSKYDPRDDENIVALVDDLFKKGRLSHSLIMRALCVGNLSIFEAGMANLANVPRVNARILLMEQSGLGLQAIYQAAGMPEGFYEAVRVLLRISLEETEFGRVRRLDFRKRVIDRIYVGKYNHTVENMEYLLSIIGGRIISAADVH